MNNNTSYSYPQTLVTSTRIPETAPSFAVNDHLERIKKSQHILEKYPDRVPLKQIFRQNDRSISSLRRVIRPSRTWLRIWQYIGSF